VAIDSSPGAHGAAGASGSLPRRGWLAIAASPVGIRPGWLLLIPLCAGVAFLVLPILALAVRAVSDGGVGGFVEVFESAMFRDALQRTLALSVVVTLISTILGTAYALALVAVPRRLAYLLLIVLLAAFWLSLLVRTFGWVLLFQPNGALDQLLQNLGLIDGSLDLLQTTKAMYPAMVHVMLPFLVLPVYAACLRLDHDLLRAGQSLGATPLAVLRHVVLPQLRPAILGGASLVFMLSLAFYITPLLIGGPSQMTIATLIDHEFSVAYDLGSAATISVVLLAIVLALYFVADRFVSLVPSVEGGK
jgi:putative spermidine/putrescine transport system permease protein